jgi:hypothetical protein
VADPPLFPPPNSRTAAGRSLFNNLAACVTRVAHEIYAWALWQLSEEIAPQPLDEWLRVSRTGRSTGNAGISDKAHSVLADKRRGRAANIFVRFGALGAQLVGTTKV